MENVLLVIGAIFALAGFCATAAALFHSSPGQTRIIRVLAWPGIKPTDRIALPLGLNILSVGALFVLMSFPGTPSLWVALPILAVGLIAGVQLGIRRGEA